MAASTRAITPTQTGSFPPSGAIPNSPNTQSLRPDASSGLGGLRASPKAISPRTSPQLLSGAAALAEQRAERDRQAREEAQRTSPNPAATALNALLTSESMSRPMDGPTAPTAQMSKPLQQVAKSIVIPENGTSETMQTSPVSLSSFGSIESTTAPTATANDTTTAPFPPLDPVVAGQERPMPENSVPSIQTQGSLAPPPQETVSNRSMTFPGPLPTDGDPRAPQRGMSLPMSGFQNSPKSPSTKRHKCPYCATDFTRHHNLKSHLLTHSQEKPYECPDCHARFRRLHDLKRHTKLHTGERPHICPKCGRRFARGDALARHNKGQGGCAGRRSSFGIDDEMGEGEQMDGIEYQHGDPEGEDGQDAERRISEPTRRGSARQNSTSGYQQHGSTYPPVLAANRAPTGRVGPIYPPTTSGTRDHSMNLSPKPNSLSTTHFASAQSSGVYSHAGMTESPKPISPGQTDHKRLGSTSGPSMPGARSPNMSQHMNPHSFSQGAGRGASLPPPHGLTNAPQLPQLPGLTPSTGTTDPRLMASGNNKPSVMQPNASNPGSTSSHGASSGGSMREIMGGARDNDMWSYIREMERANAQRQAEYEARINQLERELATVRAQLPPGQQQQQQQQPQTQAPHPESQQPGR